MLRVLDVILVSLVGFRCGLAGCFCFLWGWYNTVSCVGGVVYDGLGWCFRCFGVGLTGWWICFGGCYNITSCVVGKCLWVFWFDCGFGCF